MKKRNRFLSLLAVSTVLILIYFGSLQFKIFQYSHLNVTNRADYLIILGAKVNGTVPSLVLKARINKAITYLKENKNTIVIASGGKGPGEDISEAEAIKRELLKKEIKESRIILESQSTNTYENLLFSKKLIPQNDKKGIVVTNNFHMYRSLSIAHDQGLTVEGMPAKTPLIAVLKSYTREYLAITKYYLNKYLLGKY